MFDSFSASFPSRNTHPIRNLVTLLSNVSPLWLLLQRNTCCGSLFASGTFHWSFRICIRRPPWSASKPLAGPITRGLSVPVPGRLFLSVHCTLVQLGYNLWPPVSVGKPRVSGYAQVPASPWRLSWEVGLRLLGRYRLTFSVAVLFLLYPLPRFFFLWSAIDGQRYEHTYWFTWVVNLCHCCLTIQHIWTHYFYSSIW